MTSAQREVEARLAARGFALVQWFDPKKVEHLIDVPNRTAGAVLVGNTRSLWPHFESAPTDLPERNPLDSYVEEAIPLALSKLNVTQLRFSHEMSPAPIPIQKIAAAAGLAQVGPVGLNVHPEWGPWFALRAVALLGSSVEHSAPTGALPCASCSQPCLEPFKVATSAPTSSGTRRFLPVRDACPVGREHRYSEAQIDYHYDRKLPGDCC